MLLSRRSECDALDRVVADVRSGESRALVLRGEAGIGKTALLDYAREQRAGCLIVRAAGVEAERELAFAALHQTCGPMLGRLVHLPTPQREALRVAFGLRVGSPPDRFMVGLAILGLFADVAREQVLVLLIDDAQWLDRETSQVLGFVAPRLKRAGGPTIPAIDLPEVPNRNRAGRRGYAPRSRVPTSPIGNATGLTARGGHEAR